MSHSNREDRERIEALWLEKLHTAEQRYRDALAQMRQLQDEYASLSPSDGVIALQKALRFQNQALDEYERVLRAFTRLTVYGEYPDETLEQR